MKQKERMTEASLFDAGQRLGDPKGNPDREAIASLTGYTYQLYASVLAWLRLEDREALYLEVAEDYSILAEDALAGVQVKHTPSRTVTLRSAAQAIDHFVDLVTQNGSRSVTLRYLTTSLIGLERAAADRLEGGPSLEYWRKAARDAPIAPLRAVLLALSLQPDTLNFINARTDEELRTDLIRRIHWDTGQAPIDELAEEIEAGLIEFVVNALRLPSDVGRTMADFALAAVLKTTIRSDRRRLRRADLIALGESLGRVSVSRAVLDGLMANTGAPAAREALLIVGEILPNGPVAKRTELVAQVSDMASAHAFAVVTGSTGMGKTHVASEAAQARGGGWRIADFRYADAQASVSRLKAILGEAMATASSVVVLDDLDHLDDPSVLRAARRLVVAMRRRDGAVILTCASAPARRTIDTICGFADATVDVPYLTVDEVSDLVSQAGGSPGLGKLIFLAGSGGHPQLVQAAILHMRSSDWERGAIRQLLEGDATDIAEEKRVARDRLVGAMPPAARTLLYRTSLIFGRFDRGLALKLAEVEPEVSEPGVEFDRLVGPWIERPQRDQFRVSPLMADAGKASLASAECVRVHRAIARLYLIPAKISVTESETILYHAMAGGDKSHVLAYARSLITASTSTLKQLFRYSPSISRLSTETLVFPPDKLVSGMLRLGQLLVTLSGDDIERAKQVWHATKREMTGEVGTFEVLVLSKILIQTIIVEAIPNWLELLLRFDTLTLSHPKLAEAASELRGADGASGAEPQGFAFVFQATALRSTGLLLTTLKRLDAETPEVRTRIFSALERNGAHYGHLVDAPWLHCAKTDGFDGEVAAADYLAMAELAVGWGNSMLAARCYAAQAVMLDEYAKDPDRALAALDHAQGILGSTTVISRARAKVHWHKGNHRNALAGFEEVWDASAADGDGVERGFTAREAGINAAETGDWAAARMWFARARTSFEPFDSGTLPAIKVGLIADEAQASYEAGDVEGAIAGYARALDALSGIDPETSINTAYCHRVIRHAVLSIMRDALDTKIEIDLAHLPPGACSNPDPNDSIRSVPLAPIDIAWYMLADAALDLGQPKFFHDLYGQLVEGPILGLEVERQTRLARYVVTRDDANALIVALRLYASASAYIHAERVDTLVGEITNPTRANLPLQSLGADAQDPAKHGATDLLVSFGIVRATAGDHKAIREIRAAVGGDEWLAVRSLAKLMNGGEGSAKLVSELTAIAVAEVTSAGGAPVDPVVAMRATIRFTLWANKSSFREQLGEPVGAWVAGTWRRIIDHHRFRLRNPGENVSLISAALASAASPIERSAQIALAADSAVEMIVSEPLRVELLSLALPK